jgi:hypothetical protein
MRRASAGFGVRGGEEVTMKIRTNIRGGTKIGTRND